MVSETTPPDPRKEIIEYLHAHPSAADTVDGIIGWWLPVQRYETAREVIEKTLDELVAEGLIDCIQTGNGKKIFLLPQRPSAAKIEPSPHNDEE